MAPSSTDTRTEIIEAARAEFFTHGFEGARMQNIADQIGVTKAMIHYYFDTKKGLFEHVFKQSVKDIFGGLSNILEKDIPLFKKIEELIEFCLEKSETHPKLLTFVVTESQRKPEWLQPILEEHITTSLDTFTDQLQEAASNYKIASVDTSQLLLNIFSLCYYPALSTTINSALLGSNSHEEMPNRKGIILDTILNWLTA